MRLRALRDYWRENVHVASERYDMIARLFTIIFFVSGMILRSVHAGSVLQISDETLGVILTWLGVALGVWCLLWMPFRRHEEIQKQINKFVVHAAFWGIDDRNYDVTDYVKRRVENDKLELPLDYTDSGLRDPRPQKGKMLTIYYSYMGQPLKRVFVEDKDGIARLP